MAGPKAAIVAITDVLLPLSDADARPTRVLPPTLRQSRNGRFIVMFLHFDSASPAPCLWAVQVFG